MLLAGLYALLFWYGYSTMIAPSLPGTEWWAEWFRRAFATDLLVALPLGIGMVASGLWLLIRGMSRHG
jgi:hypothetical protein